MRCLILFFALSFCILKTFAQPTADFTANQTTGCLPLVVNFQDQSSNAVAWFWDTGVGTSTLQNPGVFYNTPGLYTIQLIVTDANGLKDTLIREDWIEVYAYPEVDFSVANPTVCTYEDVPFIDQSIAGSGQLSSWTWDFGDGNTSSDPNPIHQYSQPGTYPVSLQIANQYGCADDMIINNYIEVISPDASFEGDELLACGPPLVVQFSSLGDTTGVHQWDFGDGMNSSSVHPLHNYLSDGSFSVSHIVTDSDGCRDTVIRESYVNIGVNTLSIYATDSSLCFGDTAFLFTNASSNSSVTWHFGDGDSAVGLNQAHVYDSSGVFQVTATISDQGGCLNTLSFPIEVYDFPVAAFGVQDTTIGCEVPFEVDFVDLSTGALDYLWNFGDGTTSQNVNPSHTYQTVDSFFVNLTVTGVGGCQTSTLINNYIQIRPIQSGFLAEPKGGCVPLPVQFFDTTNSYYPLTDWYWDLGDGTTSTQPYPTHTYVDTGLYDVSLITENSRGCRDTVSYSNFIGVGDVPTADFTIDTNQACALTPVQLINQSSGAGQFFWFFSDGDTAMATHPEHGFGGTGYQDVMLIASDRGCTDTMIQEDIIFIFEPLPYIGISERKICSLPREVTFQNLSLGGDTWSWVIDGTVTSTAQSPVHTFTTDGIHYVTLTVGNSVTGCSVTSTDSLFIQNIEAQFSPDTSRGCTPFGVRFMDSSTNAISWMWEFGNGDTTSQTNPLYTYSSPGNYPVTLIVQNELNCADTLVYEYMHALDVEADFMISDSAAGCVPFPVQFIDQSSGTGTIVDWYWDFGDSLSASVPNPNHVYMTGDEYSISLTVTDNDGCIDSVVKEDLVLATQPVAEFLVNPYVNCPDYNSVFVSLSTGVGLSYLWDFGDGTTSWLANTTHAYQDTGIYTVSLTVTDVNGCDTSLTKNNHVIIEELEARFWADTTYANCPPLEVYFEGDTSYPHLGVNWYWDFGDGATSSQAFPTHVYTTPGLYTVSLILESVGGCRDTMVMEDFIFIEGPTGQFSFNPLEGCPGTEVDFEGETIDSIRYEWIFGDGNTGTGQMISHTYQSSGTYVPILVMEDSLGCRVFHVSSDTLAIYEPPVAQFTADQVLLCDSGTVTFIDQSVGDFPIVAWLWTFGDGDTSTLQYPQHIYDEIGVFDVQLIVTHAKGCQDTLVWEDFVRVTPAPSVSFTLADTIGCQPFSLTAEAMFDTHPYAIESWIWDIGMTGTTVSGPSFAWSYPDPGVYMLSLTGTDTWGCSGVYEQSVEVLALPKPDFRVNDSVGCAPSTFSFTSINEPDIVQWLWDFGDGNSSTLASPDHRYVSNGFFTVTLQVWDTNGCTESITKAELIKLDPPHPSFQVSEQEICPNQDIQFTDQSDSDLPIVEWQWDFGDGQTSNIQNPIHQYAQSGTYDVQLLVQDSYGCLDSITLDDYITVLIDQEPEVVDILSVSVLDGQRIQLDFEEYPNLINDFGSYWIYRLDPGDRYKLVGTVDQVDVSEFIDQGIQPEHTVYCYKIVIVNHCGRGYELDKATEHCNINLSARGGQDQVELSWTPYVGWHRVKNYHIYRAHDYQKNQLRYVSSVPGGTNTFIDNDIFCYEHPSYRIVAEHDLGITAYSDTALSIPNHSLPQDSTHVTRVSVENNEFITVEWEAAQIPRADQVVVKRKVGNTLHEIYREPLRRSQIKYQDMDTDVMQKSYEYQVFTIDSCGDYTPAGRPGISMHLTVRQVQKNIHLEWTPYQGWEYGVARYRIEAYEEASQSYVQIDEIAGDQHSYVDENISWEQPKICYRVTAFEEEGNQTNSLSNEACASPSPKFYHANAFTPNGDGINDKFAMEIAFIMDYHLEIYNRWGAKVFDSDNPADMWDGRTPNGAYSSEGVYLFVCKGKSYEGAEVKLMGSVTLIR